MKQYELSVLLHPDLEIDLEKPLKKVRKIITDNGGKVVNEDSLGKRRLSYRIKSEEFAVYVYMDVDLPPESVAKVDSVLNITDEVLRHLIVSIDPKEKAALAEAAERSNRNSENAAPSEREEE